MKIVLVFALVIGVVYSESCSNTDTTSCANEICAQDFVPACVTGICTCNPKPVQTQTCSSLYDCEKINYWTSHHCGHHWRACMNGKCVCNQHHG